MTTQYVRYPGSTGGGTAITTYANYAALPVSAADGAAALTLDTYTIYIYSATLPGWQAEASPTTTMSVGTIDSKTPNANGAVISGNSIYLQTATSGHVGLLTSTDWSTFNNKQSALTIGNLTEATSSVLTITGGTSAIIGSGLSIQVKQAGSGQAGYLSSTDWSTFNGKQSALTLGNLTETSSSVLTITGGTGAVVGNTSIQVKQASGSQAGYLSSTDWTTFNNKQSPLTLPLSISNGGTNSSSALAGSKVMVSNATQIVESAVTATTLGYLDATSSVQTQLNGKQATGNYITSLTSDVTASGPGAAAATIANNAVTNAKAAQMPTLTIKGNNTGGTANALDLTVAQVNLILPVFTSTLNGLAPLSGGGTTNYLRADGTWATPAGTSGITALTSDVTATGPGSVAATIANNAVTNAKAAQMAAQTIKGNSGASTANASDLSVNSVSSMLPRVGTENIYKTDFEIYDATTWTTGNNATFLTAGSIQGAVANETSSQLNGTTSLKYTNAASGINDWFANPSNIAIPIKAQGNFLSISFWYKYNGSDNDINVVVWDVTNSAYLLGNTTYPAQIKAASIATPFGASFYVPSTCANIRIGFQTATSNASKILLVDDIVVSTSPAPTNTYNSKDWTAYTPTFTNFGTVSNNVFYYSQQGGDLLVQGTLTTGTMVATLASMTLPTGLTIDSGRLSLANTTSNPGPMVGQYMVNAASSHGSVVTALGTSTSVVYFSKDAGQATPLVPATGTQISGNSLVMTIFFRVPISGWTPYSANIITPASAKTQVMTVTQANNAITDTTAEAEFNLGTATITNFYGGASTTYSSTTQLFNAVDDSGNTRTKFVALQPCNVQVNWTAAVTGVDQYTTIYKNGSIITVGNQLTTSLDYTASSTSVYLNTGDFVTVGSSNTLRAAASIAYLSILATPVYATMLAAIPPQQSCYIKDVKTQNTAGGTFTSGAWRTRDLNVINTNGSTTTDTTCAWASISSNQFTLQPGVYRINSNTPAFNVGGHQSKIYNITASADVLFGSSESNTVNFGQMVTKSLLSGTLTVSVPTTYSLMHYCTSTEATYGFGVASNITSEIYSQIEIIKVQ